jgi:hypothetical protein
MLAEHYTTQCSLAAEYMLGHEQRTSPIRASFTSTTAAAAAVIIKERNSCVATC